MSTRVKFILRFLVFIGLLASFFYFVPVGDIFHAVSRSNLSLFGVAVLIGIPGMFLTTLSTWLLAHRQGIIISLWDFFLFNLAIRFYSFFSPASAISTTMRWHKLAGTNKKAEALSAIAITRAMSIFIAIFLGLFFIILDADQELINPIFLIVLFLLMITGWVLFVRVSPSLSTLFHSRSQRFSNYWLKRISSFLGRFFASIEGYAKMPIFAVTVLILVNLGSELIGVLTYVFVAWAMNIPLSFLNLGWLRSVSFLAALAPFTLTGGIGLREVTLIVILSSLHVEPDMAVAYSFLIYARSVVFALLCGLIELVSLVTSK